MSISRRNMLNTTAFGAVALGIAACGVFSSNTVNGVATITANVSQVSAWASAFISASSLVAVLPGIVNAPIGKTISALGSTLSADLDAFTKVAGNSITLTFDATSVPAAVQSLLNDGQVLLADSKGALASVASTALVEARAYVAAIETIVTLFTALLHVAPVAASATLGTKMTEVQALTILSHK